MRSGFHCFIFIPLYKTQPVTLGKVKILNIHLSGGRVRVKQALRLIFARAICWANSLSWVSLDCLSSTSWANSLTWVSLDAGWVSINWILCLEFHLSASWAPVMQTLWLKYHLSASWAPVKWTLLELCLVPLEPFLISSNTHYSTDYNIISNICQINMPTHAHFPLIARLYSFRKGMTLTLVWKL